MLSRIGHSVCQIQDLQGGKCVPQCSVQRNEGETCYYHQLCWACLFRDTEMYCVARGLQSCWIKVLVLDQQDLDLE